MGEYDSKFCEGELCAMDKRKNQANMSSGERMKAIAAGKRPDRVPLIPMAMGFCASIVGCSVGEIYENPEKSFWAQVRSQEMYGYDGSPTYAYGSIGAWEFWGEIRFPHTEWDQSPTITRFPVQSEEDVWKLQLPHFKSAGFIPSAMAFSQLCEKFHMPILANSGTPFTWAGNLCGLSKLCRWMIRKPEVAHRLLLLVTDFLLQVIRYWADVFGAERVICIEAMPSESHSVISAEHFKEFALPYQKKIHKEALDLGISRFSCHVCGDHNSNLSSLTQIPMGEGSILSFGHEVDLTTAIEYFGDNCIIAGNVEPALIQSGSPQEIYELSKRCIEKAKYATRGFILMPGCELPPKVPPYNLYLMKKAVNDFGWYD